ncbi:MAG: RNA repair transcriptional activator RtcR [Candidatus Sumerlaeia bacterium]
MAQLQTVAIGILGPTLDHGRSSDRWGKWRPTVALCSHEDLIINRFELLYQPNFTKLLGWVVDDIHAVSPETRVVTHPIDFKDPWDFEEVYGALHGFAGAYAFDPDNEQYLIHITTGTHVAQICMFLLTESRHFPARLIQTAPPKKEAHTRAGTYEIIDLDLSRYDSIAMRRHEETRDDISFLKSGIDTRNAAFNALIERIEHVALHTADPLTLMGPTGAGKSHLARRIYELKRARKKLRGPFVEVSCATLRGDAAMSALFGHRKGAFTGAAADRKGFLLAADGGMLFLDEIGELGTDEQTLLLKAIEEKRFYPLGADQEVESDFQLICGTNRDLAAEVRAGRFREDLLARMNLWSFRLPGLRERPEDIEPNLAFELDRHAARTGTRVTFNKEARERFLAFATSPEALWPANFRDLSGAVTRMATLAPAGRIRAEIVEQEIARLRGGWRDAAADGDAELLADLVGADRAAAMDRFDRVQLAEVIRVCRRSATLSAAGRGLFAQSRQRKKTANDADRLRKYLALHGLDWAAVRAK